MSNDYITNTTLIKQVGNIEKVNETTKILPLMPASRRDVIKIIGKEKYDELKEADAIDPDKIIVALAEAYFCLSYIAPVLNKVSTGSGYTKATGFNDSRQELLGEHELQQIVNGYKVMGEQLLTEFKLPVDNDDDGNEDSCTAGHVKFIST